LKEEEDTERMVYEAKVALATIGFAPTSYDPKHRAMPYDQFMPLYAKFSADCTEATFLTLLDGQWEITNDYPTLKELKIGCRKYLKN